MIQQSDNSSSQVCRLSHLKHSADALANALKGAVTVAGFPRCRPPRFNARHMCAQVPQCVIGWHYRCLPEKVSKTNFVKPDVRL
eukprot:1192784-Prorocentrum_minimum.AAC.2